jgi:acyl carrier protein
MPDVLDAVLAVVSDLNLQLPPDRRMALSRETQLLGPGGHLDSLGLINLIVGVEQHVEQALSRRVILTDHDTLSRTDTVLATIGTLTDHIEALLSERPGGE